MKLENLICYSLLTQAETRTKINSAEFVKDLVRKYNNAVKQGYKIIGPFILETTETPHSYIISDIRGGWGFNPLNIPCYFGNDNITLEDIEDAIVQRAMSLRRESDKLLDLVKNL